MGRFIRRANRSEVWYWPEQDIFLEAWEVEPKVFLLYFTDVRYYYHPIRKQTAKKYHAMIFLGEL